MQDIDEALTFDDVLLVPRYSNILPRDAKLDSRLTREIALEIPLISAAMDTVTESRLAITVAQEGGIGIIHKNMTADEQARQVLSVKKFESGVIGDPITVSPKASIREVLDLTQEYDISGVPVVDGEELVKRIAGAQRGDLRHQRRHVGARAVGRVPGAVLEDRPRTDPVVTRTSSDWKNRCSGHSIRVGSTRARVSGTLPCR